jgi:hypothetical protein
MNKFESLKKPEFEIERKGRFYVVVDCKTKQVLPSPDFTSRPNARSWIDRGFAEVERKALATIPQSPAELEEDK